MTVVAQLTGLRWSDGVGAVRPGRCTLLLHHVVTVDAPAPVSSSAHPDADPLSVEPLLMVGLTRACYAPSFSGQDTRSQSSPCGLSAFLLAEVIATAKDCDGPDTLNELSHL